MKRSSRVLQHGNPKIWFFFSKKFKIRILTCAEELKSPQLRYYQSYIGNWCINRKVFTSTTAWEPKNLFFFFQKSLKFKFWFVPKSWNHPSFVTISPTLVIDTSMERSSRVLQHGNPRFFFFQKSSKFEFWLVTMSWNHLSFVNISPAIVIDTSMERSSRVLQHGHIKIWFFQTNSEVNFDLYFIWLVFFLSSKLNFDLFLTCAKELKSFM